MHLVLSTLIELVVSTLVLSLHFVTILIDATKNRAYFLVSCLQSRSVHLRNFALNENKNIELTLFYQNRDE